MLRRIAPASVAAVLLLGGLTACGTSQDVAADCDSLMQAGALSDSVALNSAFGERVGVSIPDDVEISTSQRTLTRGTADRTAERADGGSLVGVNMAFFDAATGEQLYEGAGFQGGDAEFLLVSDEAPSAMSEAVRCAAAGDRVTLALAPSEAMQLVGQIGGTPGAAMVGVMDVVSVADLSVQGRVRSLPSGFPAVVTNNDGWPGVVLPPNAAPKGMTSGVRILGKGEKVSADQNVVAQVLEVSWEGQELNNTWPTGPTMLYNEDLIAQSGNTFRTELTGLPVGSQIVIIENDGADARVLVVDILGVA